MFGLSGPDAPAWAQAYLSAAAIVVSGALAVWVPAMDRRQRRKDAQETAFHALVDAYSVLHSLLKYAAGVGADAGLDLVLIANLDATNALLAQTAIDQLGSYGAMRAVADTRREVYIVSQIIARSDVGETAKRDALANALQSSLRNYERFRVSTGRADAASGPAIEARFAAEADGAS